MKKFKKYEEVGEGIICRKCNISCVIRKRIVPPRGKNFYYKQWNYCKKCNSVYFNEEDKSIEWVEKDQQDLFFRGLRNGD